MLYVYSVRVTRINHSQLNHVIYRYNIYHQEIQGDLLYMAVCFWYLGKNYLSTVHVYSSVSWTSYFLQGTSKSRSCLSGHVVSGHVRFFSPYTPNIFNSLYLIQCIEYLLRRKTQHSIRF